MAGWIAKPWIEQALMCRDAKSLPKIARAQVLKLEPSNNNLVAFISDKKLFVKAVFSPIAIEQFKRDNPSLLLPDIQGGLIFIKTYSVEASSENELDQAEFVIKIQQFKFAGGEGNTQFGSNVIDSSTYPLLMPRLNELSNLTQWKSLLWDGDISDNKEIERTLTKSYGKVSIPEIMQQKLVEIPEWKPSYCPPQTCVMQSDISSFGSATLNSLQAQPSSSFVAVDGNEQSLSTREHSGYLHPSVGSKGSVEGNVLDVKDNYKKSSIQAKISVKTSEIVGETTTCIGTFQQLESVGLCNQTENALPSMYTPEKQNLGGGSQTGGPKTPTEISRESTLNEAVCTVTDKLVASCGSSLVAVSSNVQRPVNACITASEPKGEQASLNYPEKQVSAKVCISPDTKSDLENGRGLRVITDRNKPSRITR
ncbi:hypothetical protein OS493_009975 [Desmophyllum pertusum]|uniref:Shelterin complex subunit TPP1/Est3 domain-containing protein n=1 Tax=Desmophyllum pertusum TaxID=174260 RepID=A0A9W9YEE3_9CNID|nr:hypothetical protein OS493_009975 [Desmophyllum pertusum]